MTARRGTTSLSGILVIDKPTGMTSHDVVARLRRATGERRIGHAGTLDPLATGILVVLVGSATRLERYLSGHDKSYCATVCFGVETDTLDSDGKTLMRHSVPASVLDRREAQRILDGFVGPQSQIPPAYSAIKRDGVPAYRLARAGVEVEMASRDIVVHEAALESIDPDTTSWEVHFSVSKGTYIRSLARDLGTAAGSGAHLSALSRTSVGSISLDEAHTLDDACDIAAAGALADIFSDPVPALGFPVMEGPSAPVRAGHALRVPPSIDLASEDRVSVLVDGRLGAVYRQTSRGCVPETVFIPEVAR
ncbi:MAG: tRNA pseudouridine(55) synthase TruB [Coriobacteriia bacterium]|nr:tRNA pseudouridine(55) synthase TruB [Coriobacteriia bacterium]